MPGLLLGVLLACIHCVSHATTITTAAAIEQQEGRSRVVLEFENEPKFTLFIPRSSDRLVLELEEAEIGPVLAGLANQVNAGQPILKSIRIDRSPTNDKTVRLALDLTGEADPSIRKFKPEGSHGYRLVLDIVPVKSAVATPSASAGVFPPTAPADQKLPAAPTSATAAADHPSLPALPAQAREMHVQQAEDQNLVLLEVRLDDHVLTDAISAYQYGPRIFLPLGELARLLTLAIQTRPGQGVAEGYVIAESRAFRLDIPAGRFTLGDKVQLFDTSLVRTRSDDIYVAIEALARWLPLTLDVDFASLTLRVHPRETLPLQARLAREQLGASVRAGSVNEDRGYARQALPYRLFGTPSIDQTIGLGSRSDSGGRQTSVTSTTYLAADLLGMESSLFVSAAKQHPSDVRFSVGRYDPEARLLGAARASSFAFGSGVMFPSVANIAIGNPMRKGYGLSISNRPITQPTSFDHHTLRGDLPPGWDVELYFNDSLVGFQTASVDGRYNFADMPLVYGMNEFRLVFHGPLGQQRVERQSFLLDQSSTPAGAVYYNFAQHRDSVGQSRTLGQFEWGLDKHLTGTGGFVRLPASADVGIDALGVATTPGVAADGRMYANIGLRTYWNALIVSDDVFKAANAGWLNDLGVKTRIAGTVLSYDHLLLKDFSSDVFLPSTDPLRTRDKVRLDGAIVSGLLPRMPMTVQLQRDQLQSGANLLNVTGRLSVNVNRTAIANEFTWQASPGVSSASGLVQVSRRLTTFGLTGQIGYGIRPQAKLQTIAISGDKRLGDAYLLNLGLARAIGAQGTSLTAALNKSIGRFGLGLTGSLSSRGDFSVGLQFFISMAMEPRERQWFFDARPHADTGAASVRVFVDHNANGVMDPGDEPIPNVAVAINGSPAPVRTDAHGIAWVDHLPIKEPVDIRIDSHSLEDPDWMPQRPGARIVLRPGRAAEIDIPVVLTTEVDGTVYLASGASKRGIGNVLMELLGSDGKVISRVKTGPDGYYVFSAVQQGRYVLRIAPAQLKDHGLVDPGERVLMILDDGRSINGVDFQLRHVTVGSPALHTNGTNGL